MTSSGRNTLFKAGIAVAAICTFLVIIASFQVIPAYALIDTEDFLRPSGFFHTFSGNYLGTNFYAVHAALAAAVIYSLVSTIMIYYFFEKTQSPEILYIAFFSISFSFEAARLILPLHFIHNIPFFYQLIVSRLLLFGRYFGIFSLFTASICAAGFDVQKTRSVILSILFVTLIIAAGTHIDTQNRYTSLNMLVGFPALFRFVERAALIITVVSFFASSSIRGSKEYAHAGIGALFAMTGRGILLYSDNWAGPVLGILFLSLGTWFICSRLHKIYFAGL